jgi:peroxiredoxin
MRKLLRFCHTRIAHFDEEPPMATHAAPARQLGWNAAPFDLPGVDGKRHSLESSRGPKGLVVMFICNHCPYVLAVIDKIVRDARDLAALGVGSIAISSNDAVTYPDDSFDNMKGFAQRHGLPIPYCYDESQDIARAYDAVCTPDFYGFDADLRLAYHGRLDASGRSPDPTASRELYDAMAAVAETGRAAGQQHASIGCSIKWRSER